MPSTILSDNGVSSGSAGLKTTASNDGSLALQTTTGAGAATTAVTIDTAQNMGLGVTPSAWGSTSRAMQFQSGVSIFSNSSGLGGVGNNVYSNPGTGDYYIANGYATRYYQYNGTHVWNTAASGTAGNAITFTQAMTLDASGRLLVGATTDYGFGGKILTRGGGVVASSSTWDNSTTGGAIAMFCDNANYGTIWALKNGNQAWGDVAIAPSGGNLLVGTTSANGSYNTRLTLSSDSGTTKWAVGPYSSATNFVVSAGSNGVYLAGTSATSWSSASDERAKADLQPIENGLQKVCSLRALTGRYIEDETNTRKSFLIAQDVLAVLPEAVDTANPEKYGLAYTDTIPLLVAAIKELKAEFDAYKATHP